MTFYCIGCLRWLDEPPEILSCNREDGVCSRCEYRFRECFQCGDPESVHLAEYEDGEWYCLDCHEENDTNDTIQCARCGESVEPDDVAEHNDEYCEECFRISFRQCDCCGDYEHRFDMYRYQNLRLCESCNENYEECERCNYAYDRYSDEIQDVGGWYVSTWVCNDCNVSSDPEEYRDVDARIIGGTGRTTTTFGVEVESKFKYGPPCELGSYSNYFDDDETTPASAPFFSGWRAERDSTVDAEFPSPVLQGAEGLAEIIETLRVIKRHDGYMDASCGAHITTQIPNANYRTPVNVQRLTYVMEEALYALTGAYHRMSGSYASRIKDGYYNTSNLKDKEQVDERHVSAKIRNDELVEFRYPPGTLVPEQMAINIGVTQLIAAIAGGLMTEEEIDNLFDEDVDIEEDGSLTTEEKIHAHVKQGAWLLSFFGWFAERGKRAPMTGLPYDPDDPAQVKIEDHAHGKTTHTRLPERNEILERMQRQITRFYSKMDIQGELERTWLNETLELLGIPAVEKAEV